MRCMETVNMETHTTNCKIDSQWEFAVCLRKLKWALINLDGWDGRETEGGHGGRGYM